VPRASSAEAAAAISPPANAELPATAKSSDARGAVAPPPDPTPPIATPPIAPSPIATPPIALSPAPRVIAPSEEARLYSEAGKERDPARAVALFDEVARRGGPSANTAAYQAARLVMESGRLAEARARWTILIDRNPGAALDQEARLSLLECELRTDALAAARTELERFLAAYPKSERQPELRFLRAEILRRSGRCADALPDYRAAASSRRADDALYFEAWCTIELGDRDAARRALESYLSRFPRGTHRGDAERGLEKL
jgi:TolA-binding protein